MKNLFLLLLLLPLFFSCSSDNDNIDVTDITSIGIEAIGENLYIGDEYQVKIISAPQTIKASECIWTSSNNDVASISQSGLLTLKSKGNTTISVSYGDISSSIIIKVYDTLFGYRFGSTMEQVNPEVKISSSFGYNWGNLNLDPPMRAFKFNNILTSIWSCYDYPNYVHLFIKEASQLNPPSATFYTNEYGSQSFESDSIVWIHQDYEILLRKGIIPIHGEDKLMYIIEYTQAN